MKIKFSKYRILPFMISLLLLTSCSKVGLLSEDNSWLIQNINSIGDFFKVYLIVQLSIVIIGVLLSFLLGRLGYVISLVIHFIWIIAERDYGFFKVLMLFGLFSLISFVFSLLRGNNK